MQAWLLPAYTGIESLTLGTAPDPIPAPTEIVLKLQFAALNPADRYLAQGAYPAKPTFPHILGRDGVGIVTQVGSAVTGIRTGDTRLILRTEVGVNRPGTLAQFVAIDAHYTVPVPQGWSLEQAAAAPLVYLTAWQALTQWDKLPDNAVILITGASGGVGVAATQLACALGYSVIALSRSEEKSAKLRELGATFTFNPQDKTWRDQAKSQLNTLPPIAPLSPQSSSLSPPPPPRRVDLVIDNIGGDLFNHVLEVMAPHGRISVVGRLAGPVPNFNTSALLFRRLKIGGIAIATYTLEESHAAWQNVLTTLAKTSSKPLIDHVYNFAEVPQAFTQLEQGPMGKVLIRI